MDKPKRIAIIGGGWAGLSCAERLLRASGASVDVTLFESAPALGGRARGLIWQPDGGRSIAIDNGQHLTIGAYQETFALLSRCGAKHWPSSPLIWSGVTSNRQITQQWSISDAAWPWRAIAGLLPPHRPQGWPWAWQKSLAATLLHLVRHDWQPDLTHQTALQWLLCRNAPQGLMDHFWRPLIEGALNTELESASAAVSLRVLKDSMAGARDATRVWLPPSDLSSDGVDPIARSLQSQGLKIHTSHQVLQLQSDGGLSVRSSDQIAAHAFDAVVLACPHHASLRLWQDSGLAMGAAAQRWQSLEHRAITTVWVALDAAASKALSTLPQWFILNRTANLPHIAQVAVLRSDALALVISAQRPHVEDGQQQPSSSWSSHSQSQMPSQTDQREGLIQQVVAQLDLDIRKLPQKWITEKRATWACTATAPMASADESLGHTGEGRIFRAADDLEPGYPATIESAVRSGQRTADTVISELRT